VLTKLTERVYVLPGGVNIGVVRIDDTHVALIDTGLNDSSAKKAMKAAREVLNSEVSVIVTTHGHADHYGGNATVVKRTNAKVYAPELDEVMLRYPILQPAILYGGADPIDSVRTPFILADASPVDYIYTAGTLAVPGIAAEAISLAGHSANQMGIRIDGVLFSADVVLPEMTLQKYRIPFVWSVTDHLRSLQVCSEIGATAVVPGHGPIMETIDAVRDANLAVVLETAEAILDASREPINLSNLMTATLNARGAEVSDSAGYYLLQPTMLAYLSHLTRTGDLQHTVTANESRWVRI